MEQLLSQEISGNLGGSFLVFVPIVFAEVCGKTKGTKLINNPLLNLQLKRGLQIG
jgi:hypothetical protein